MRGCPLSLSLGASQADVWFSKPGAWNHIFQMVTSHRHRKPRSRLQVPTRLKGFFEARISRWMNPAAPRPLGGCERRSAARADGRGFQCKCSKYHKHEGLQGPPGATSSPACHYDANPSDAQCWTCDRLGRGGVDSPSLTPVWTRPGRFEGSSDLFADSGQTRSLICAFTCLSFAVFCLDGTKVGVDFRNVAPAL